MWLCVPMRVCHVAHGHGCVRVGAYAFACACMQCLGRLSNGSEARVIGGFDVTGGRAFGRSWSKAREHG